MILLLSAFALIGGTLLTCAPEQFPANRIALERCSGIMVIAGLALIGGALPLFR